MAEIKNSYFSDPALTEKLGAKLQSQLEVLSNIDQKFESKNDLKSVANQFEAIFLEMLLKQARESKLSEGLFDTKSDDNFVQMLDTELAKSSSELVDIGIAEFIIEQMSSRGSGWMSDIYGIAKSGLQAYKEGLATTGQNIANVGNEAYAKREAPISEIKSGSDVLQISKSAGYGVKVDGITRAFDKFIDVQLQNATSGFSFQPHRPQF